MARSEKDPYGRVTKERQTSARPSPAAGVGNERKADVRGVQEGGSAAEGRCGPGESHLRHAVDELHRQHPHHHSVGGHHHGDEHHRHVPMHGMKVASHEYSRSPKGSGAAHPQHKGHSREGLEHVGHRPAGR